MRPGVLLGVIFVVALLPPPTPFKLFVATAGLLHLHGAALGAVSYGPQDRDPIGQITNASLFRPSRAAVLDTANNRLATARKTLRFTAAFDEWVNIPLEGEALIRFNWQVEGSNGGDSQMSVGAQSSRVRA